MGDSETLFLSHGVAQGSLIGPILFLVFINDLSCFLPHGRLLSYADDTQLLDSSPPDVIGMSSLKSRVEESIQSLQSWFQSNSLKMNPGKTDFILIGTKASIRKTADFHINISGTTIKPSTTVKALGVLLDQHLTWEAHISMITRRCNAILISLYKIRSHLSHDALKLLVAAHVFPHLYYCMSVWGGAADCHLNRLQKVQNFAARLVSGARRRDHVSPVLRALGWPDIEDMVRRHDSVNVHRALHDPESPASLRSLFTVRADVTERHTRGSASGVGTLHLPRVRLTTTQRHFSYRAASAWNSLPPAAVHAPTRRILRSVLNA